MPTKKTNKPISPTKTKTKTGAKKKINRIVVASDSDDLPARRRSRSISGSRKRKASTDRERSKSKTPVRSRRSSPAPSSAKTRSPRGSRPGSIKRNDMRISNNSNNSPPLTPRGSARQRRDTPRESRRQQGSRGITDVANIPGTSMQVEESTVPLRARQSRSSPSATKGTERRPSEMSDRRGGRFAGVKKPPTDATITVLVYLVLVAMYMKTPDAIMGLHPNAKVALRALPLLWLVGLGLPFLSTSGRYKVFILTAILSAAGGEAGLEMKKQFFTAGMLLHGIAFILIVGAMGVRPFGKLYKLVTVFLGVAMVYLYISVAISDPTLKLCLTFNCINIFLMIWRATILLGTSPNRPHFQAVYAGCMALVVAETAFMFATFHHAIVNPDLVVPICFYGGMLVLDLVPHL